MSYQIIDEKPVGKVATDENAFTQMKVMHIVCDTVSNIPNPLPAWSAGSRCDVTADGGSVYMLNNARSWEKVNFFGNAGGDSGTSNYEALLNKPSVNNTILSGNRTAADLDLYTRQQTDSRITEKIAEIVAEAPEDFDTLKEMSDWIAGHEESAAAMNTAIQGKVDKIPGKQLSTEDYTTAEKTKLAGLQNYDDTSCIKNIFGTSLASGDDLNTYTTAGTYACTSGVAASSLINCPYTGSGFRLDVLQTSSVNFLKQIVQPNQLGTDSNIYHRTYAVSTDSWSPWYKIQSQEVTA